MEVSPVVLIYMSFNVTGLKRVTNQDYIRKLINEQDIDVLFLQETWLLEEQHDIIGNISSDYKFTAQSGVDSGKQLLPGRPSGGIEIRWRKTLSDRVTPLVTNNKRFCAIEFCINAMFKLLLICCYLPCDSRTQDVSNDSRECCDAIEVFMSKQSYTACVIIGGDLNVEIMRQTGNSKYFFKFC